MWGYRPVLQVLWRQRKEISSSYKYYNREDRQATFLGHQPKLVNFSLSQSETMVIEAKKKM